jgi:hypothetical protein
LKVMVVPEDPSLDQYILKPLVEQLFADLGKSPRVQILSKPRLRGVAQALNAATLADIVATYPMVDLFLVLVDRDGRTERHSEATARENEHPSRLFVCLAIEEVEVWMLALHRDALGHDWSGVRAEHHPKERFAQPFLAERAPKLDLGGGRAWAMRPLGQKWKGVLDVCPELAELKQRLSTWLESPR